MTNEQNFKVGDKVRSKVAIFAIPAGVSGVVAAICHDGRYKVRLDGEKEWHGWYAGKDLELVESFDRKTAFLRELQALLRKYDAHIEPCGYEIEGLSIVIKDNEEIYYKMDDFSPMKNLTADNIMDFDNG